MQTSTQQPPAGLAPAGNRDLLADVGARNRARGVRLRIDHPGDCRAFLWRCAQRLAATGHADDDRLCGALLLLAAQDQPPQFEAILGIPEEWPGKCRDRRNDALIRASRYLDSPQGVKLGRALHGEWALFAGRIYHLWREDGGPPDNAGYLHSLLYEATRLNDGEVLGAKQVCNVLAAAGL